MATTENGIYYPSDYSSVADVPGDMKKMAESIDANKVQKVPGKTLSTNDFTNEYKQKLDNLENYDDTETKEEIQEIKENITQIEEEQETQNTNIENLQEKDITQEKLIEKLQEENKRIKRALINVETEQAKSLHIEDASTVAGKLEVEGNAEQETREGYNKFNAKLFSNQTKSGVTQTIQKDGTISISGTGKTTDVYNETASNKKIPLNLKTGKLYVKMDKQTRPGIYLRIFTDSKTITTFLNFNGSVDSSIDITEEMLAEGIYLEQYIYAKSNITIIPNNVKVMLYQDGDGTYEPYGAMPSPKFPSAIKCLGSNKNIYPGWEHGTVSQETGNLQNDSKYIRSVDFIPVLPNVNYCLKAYDLENISMLNTAVRMYDANKQYLGNQHVGNIQSTEQTFTITNTNVRYIKPVHLNSTDIPDTAKANIKLEEGTEATSYSLFEQGSTKISKINENLFDKNNYIKIYDGQVNSSGVISTSDARHKTLLIECRPNVELSAYIKNKNNSYSRLLSCFDEEPVVGETEATATSTSPNGLHITTTSNTKYLAIYLGATFDENWVSLQDIIDSVMLVKGNVSLTSKDYVEHEEQNFTMPVQQEMLQGDYFDLDTLEEVHNWSEIIVSELLSKDIAIGSASTEQYYVFQIPLGNENQIAEKVLCEKLKFLGFEKATNQREEEGIAINQDAKRFGRIWIKASRLSEKSISAFLNLCAEENIIIKALVENNETRLPMTAKQIEIIKQLNNLDLFKPVTNIITTEDIALLKLNYVVDTKTYVDNKIANMQEELDTINQLLSTTQTSSILLDNLQTDLEGEVM